MSQAEKKFQSILPPDAEQPGEDYKVGYRKPPLATRFKKGQSGNPSGRPRGAKNLMTILRKAMTQKVRVTENRRTRVMTKLEIGMEQLLNKAAQGDLRALAMVTQLVGDLEAQQEVDPNFAHTDQELLQSISRRVMGLEPGLDRGHRRHSQDPDSVSDDSLDHVEGGDGEEGGK